MGQQDRVWISAAEARALLEGSFKHNSERQHALVSRLAGDLIKSKARRMILEVDQGKPEGEDNVAVNAAFWSAFRDHPNQRIQEDWSVGDFSVHVYNGHNSHFPVRLFDVVFCKQDVLLMLPPVKDHTPNAVISKGPVQTPSKSVSDRLPASKPDLERASQLYLQFFPTGGTELHAHRVATALLETKLVARDRFLDVFRLIRPKKARGRSKP